MAQPRGTPETWEAEASPLPAVRRSPRLSKQAWHAPRPARNVYRPP